MKATTESMVSFVRVVLVHIELTVFLLQSREQTYISATDVIRDVKRDLFPISKCAPPSHCKAQGAPSTLPSACRDNLAVCEGSLCCMCRCPAHYFRPTYVDDKIRNISGCVDNSKLPMKLSMDRNGMVLVLFLSKKWFINF